MKTCETCGRDFEPTNPKNANKYCGRPCFFQAMRVFESRQCARCGKSFDAAPHLAKKYCGTTCMVQGRATTRRLDPLEKVCPACGKTFTVPRHGGWRKQVLCSTECRDRSRYRRGARAQEMSLQDAAYIAGLVDGEGSVILYMHREVVSVRLYIANTFRPVLEWLTQTTGVGRVVAGRAETEKAKASWAWQCQSEAAETVLRQIRPFMRIKRAQADLAVETQERLRDPALKSDRAWQGEYRQMMKAMNRRGPQSALSLTSGG